MHIYGDTGWYGVSWYLPKILILQTINEHEIRSWVLLFLKQWSQWKLLIKGSLEPTRSHSWDLIYRGRLLFTFSREGWTVSYVLGICDIRSLCASLASLLCEMRCSLCLTRSKSECSVIYSNRRFLCIQLLKHDGTHFSPCHILFERNINFRFMVFQNIMMTTAWEPYARGSGDQMSRKYRHQYNWMRTWIPWMYGALLSCKASLLVATTMSQ